ncbi:MAG TPA: acetyl-CoA C-acyltransferase, partial [Acidobacteriota bacterium]|nr:acetyl-CoA C-acyltransferase [Acidobacteriota bacterium]
MNYDNSRPRRAVFVDGCRIPFLRSGTGYRDLTAYDLARMALQRLLFRTGIAPELVDQVILGTVVSNVRTSNV